MEKYFQRIPKQASPLNRDNNDPQKKIRLEINSNELVADPGLRPKITSYHPNDRNKIRRAYWQKGPCQPNNHDFALSPFGKQKRRFNSAWFSEFGAWLEYSLDQDAAFCLCCYLFKPDIGEQSGGDSFVGKGYNNWKHGKAGLYSHVGGPDSSHNKALSNCEDLVNQDQHIETVMFKASNQARIDYRTRLTASIDSIRLLLLQGLSFRGHDESEDSSNRGNFLTVLQFLADQRQDIGAVVLKNAPENHKLTSPDIQKDIVNAVATETRNGIINDIGDDYFFSILVDECRDESAKEQMAVALRYVNDAGMLIECFLGIEHVTSTTSLSLKSAIDKLFSTHGLSISRVRGQGYDGASNMQGEFNGLKTLIMKENESAYFIHCFAHQLQLALIAVAKKHHDIAWFFNSVTTLVNVAGASCKRRDTLREEKAKEVIEALSDGEISSGRGLNQETNLARSCDTRWSSHYKTLGSLIYMYSAVIDVLEGIRDDGYEPKQKGEARGLLFLMNQFDFIFSLHLMKTMLSITNELSQALQRKEQDIVNAIKLVELSKKRFDTMRESGWDSLIEEILSFCAKHSVKAPSMEDYYLVGGRSRRGGNEITNLHHYRVELFYTVLDIQIQELNNRFNEKNSELLLCMVCLNPNDAFSTFDKQKLIHLASFYPNDFSTMQRMVYLGDQLDTYILDMRSNSEFSGLKGLGSLAQKMVQTQKNEVYPLVYRLVKLTLILPVATATVEREFSAMKIVKNRLRNRMGDQFLQDTLLVYIERERFKNVSNESIIQRFQKMKKRREQL